MPGPGDENAPAELEREEHDDDDADEKCPDCLGHGYWCARYPDGEAVLGSERMCETCDGRGHLHFEREWHAQETFDSLDERTLDAMERAS